MSTDEQRAPYSITPEGIELTIDSSLYSPTSAQKAGYKFGDRCYVSLNLDGESTIRVQLRPKRSLENLEHLAGEFFNELLDQQLRAVVSDKTNGIRNLLIAQAFSKTSLISDESESADFRDDPASIADHA